MKNRTLTVPTDPHSSLDKFLSAGVTGTSPLNCKRKSFMTEHWW